MPTKIDTEVQILRLLSRSSIQIESHFLRTASYDAKHNIDHLDKFYYEFSQIEDDYFDAIIITGAPVEQLDFEDVQYFGEFKKIVDWAKTHVFACLYICWGAQAGLYLDYQVSKTLLDSKLFGIYSHDIVKKHRFTRGFDDVVMIPQSRHTDIDNTALKKLTDSNQLNVLVESSAIGPNIITSKDSRKTYILGHFEYDLHTLEAEYKRDLIAGKKIDVPKNYYPEDNPNNMPHLSWRSHANLFFINWVDFIYQTIPYDWTDQK